MKRFLLLAALMFCFAFNTATVSAQYGQYGQPGPSQSILIDKMVGKPVINKGGTDVQYVDNLSSSDPRFAPGQDVFFKLSVKNTSNVTITSVMVKDVFPAYIDPIEGPGIYDKATRTLTFNAGDFAVNDEKVYYFKARVQGQNQLPTDKGLFCLINSATAWNNDVIDSDTAQFCVEKQVQGVTNVPVAGPEMGLLLVSSELATLGLGIFLKRKTA